MVDWCTDTAKKMLWSGIWNSDLLLISAGSIQAIYALAGIQCFATIACCGELVCLKGVCVEPYLAEAAAGTLVSAELFHQAISNLHHAYGYPAPTTAKYEQFVQAANHAQIANKQEAAMFLANVLQESNGLTNREEYGPPYAAFDADPAHPERSYHGRGYLMLRGWQNYQDASEDLYGDDRLVRNPDLVKHAPGAWDTAAWFWVNKVHNQEGVSEGKFGVTNKIVSGGSGCGETMAAYERYDIYKKVLGVFDPDAVPDRSGCPE